MIPLQRKLAGLDTWHLVPLFGTLITLGVIPSLPHTTKLLIETDSILTPSLEMSNQYKPPTLCLVKGRPKTQERGWQTHFLRVLKRTLLLFLTNDLGTFYLQFEGVPECQSCRQPSRGHLGKDIIQGRGWEKKATKSSLLALSCWIQLGRSPVPPTS